MISVVGAFFLLALSIDPIVSLARAWQAPILGWQPSAQPGADRLVSWLSALAPALFSVCAFILIYRLMPRTRVGWRDVWLGGLIAGLIWGVGKQIFAWYVGNVATYNVIYGSVGAIIAFLLWCYLSGQILLLGAEFTAQYSRWRLAAAPWKYGRWASGRPTGRAQGRSRQAHDLALTEPGVIGYLSMRRSCSPNAAFFTERLEALIGKASAGLSASFSTPKPSAISVRRRQRRSRPWMRTWSDSPSI